MPTYEYRCPKGHDFEHFVLRMSEATSVRACPTCGADAERRISAGGGLLFKGSGFYITDYGKDGKKDQRARPAATTESGGQSATAGSGAAAESSGGQTAAGKSAGEGSGAAKSGGEGSGAGKSGRESSGAGKSGGEKSRGESSGSAAQRKKDSAPAPSGSSGSSDK